MISLEEHSALSRLTGTMYMGSLSDLIYYYRQGEYSPMRLGSMIYNWGGMDYVPPVVYAEDLAEIQGEDYRGYRKFRERNGTFVRNVSGDLHTD